MAGLDCSEVSLTAWPTLQAGMSGTVTVSDEAVHSEMRTLAGRGLALGDCSAASLAALRALPGSSELSAAVGLGPGTRVLVVATEGPTDPDAYLEVLADRA
jgi:diaminopropionate ammonia-lyase